MKHLMRLGILGIVAAAIGLGIVLSHIARPVAPAAPATEMAEIMREAGRIAALQRNVAHLLTGPDVSMSDRSRVSDLMDQAERAVGLLQILAVAPEDRARTDRLAERILTYRSEISMVFAASSPPGQDVREAVAHLGQAVSQEAEALVQLAMHRLDAGLSRTSDTASWNNDLVIAALGFAVLVVSIGSIVARRRLQDRLEQIASAFNALATGARDVDIGRTADDPRLEAIAEALQNCASAMRTADASKAAISRMALTDVLTGLANRRGLNESIRALTDADPGDGPPLSIGLMHVDLDHFKTVNDRLGHDAGDFVLKEAARRMQSTMGPDDLLARIGGDEFVMVVQFSGGPDVLSQRADRLVRQFQTPILYEQETCAVGASVGVLLCGSAGQMDTVESMLAHADLALTRAKMGGRNRYVTFERSMARDHAKEREVAENLHRAFGTNAFETWYQPMVDATGQRLAGVEMLVRWRHPEQGLVLPSRFLAIAESRNLTQEISAETFPAACRTFRAWRDQGIEVPKLYLNLSRSELLVPGLADKFLWFLDEADLTTDQIAVEVEEEDCTGRSVELVIENLARLNEIGVEIVLEGFGGSDASISTVIRLGVRKIKLSRTLVDRMRQPTEQNRILPILRGLIGFGTELGVVMVGKGVSAPAQIRTLTDLGCMELQGDAIAPAMPEDVARQWLTHHAQLNAPTAGRTDQPPLLRSGEGA